MQQVENFLTFIMLGEAKMVYDPKYSENGHNSFIILLKS